MSPRRTVFVTGATAGLGLAVCEALATDGHRLIVHGRTATSAAEVADLLRTQGAEVTPVHAELGSLSGLAELAEQVRSCTDRLDVLVNNAGIGAGPPPHATREQSAEGHELRFAVNYLAAVQITRLLLPLLEASTPSRIVNVGSVGQAPPDFDDIDFYHGYSGVQAYFRSKFAVAAFSRELALRLPAGISVTCVHPASMMDTKQVREVGVPPWCTVQSGVQPVLRLVLADAGLRNGAYYDGVTASSPHPSVADAKIRARLWQLTDELLGPFSDPIR